MVSSQLAFHCARKLLHLRGTPHLSKLPREAPRVAKGSGRSQITTSPFSHATIVLRPALYSGSRLGALRHRISAFLAAAVLRLGRRASSYFTPPACRPVSGNVADFIQCWAFAVSHACGWIPIRRPRSRHIVRCPPPLPARGFSLHQTSSTRDMRFCSSRSVLATVMIRFCVVVHTLGDKDGLVSSTSDGCLKERPSSSAVTVLLHTSFWHQLL